MKLALKVTIGLMLLVIILSVSVWIYLKSSLPQINGVLEIEGLKNKVEIVRDSDGVPHIFALNDYDALFAQGYIHAQDRMWQLEYQRRAGAGRLSEILGTKTLESDKYIRTLGFYRSAKSAYSVLDKDTKMLLDAYVAGINAWIEEEHPLPIEFKILGFKPKRWNPIDSLVWVKMMDLDLSKNYKSELRRIRLIRMFGKERAADLTPEYPEDGISIISPEELSMKSLNRLISFHYKLENWLNMGGIHKGSNNWVISGQHTVSGKPVLANDPHLEAGIPSVWYLNELKGDRLHVVGASIPGLPGIVIGHNEDIAWGITNFGPDTQDLFIEKINPENQNQYWDRNKWVNMNIIEEKIYVKGKKKPIRWAARSTRHGPMLSDVIQSADLSLALRWTALDEGDTTLNAFTGINRAGSWQDFETALKSYVAPIQNFVFADKLGNIGYIGYGKVPIRKRGDGLLPVPGWNGRYDWKSYLPIKQLPKVLNPQKGFIVTANNRVVPKNYPYLLSKEWATPHRSQRITELIEEFTKYGDKIKLEDMAKIQGDQMSLQSLELLPYLLKIKPDNVKQAKALAYLNSWDGVTSKRSIATTIYQAWVNHLGNHIIKDDLKKNQNNDLYTYFSDRRLALFLLDVLEAEKSAWCDNVFTPKIDTCMDAVKWALNDAILELEERMGENMTEWQWGKIHKTQFPHRPFSQIFFLKPFFHREIENGGAHSTVNPSPPKYSKGYKNYLVPGFRMLIDMNDFNHCFFIQTPGQSGQFLSRHYDDLMERHNNIRYLNMTFGRDKASGDVLQLNPVTGVRTTKDYFFKKYEE